MNEIEKRIYPKLSKEEDDLLKKESGEKFEENLHPIDIDIDMDMDINSRKKFERIKNFLKICSNSKPIMWIAIIELIINMTTHFFGSTSAKWYFLGWFIWLIIILSARIHFNGSLRLKN